MHPAKFGDTLPIEWSSVVTDDTWSILPRLQRHPHQPQQLLSRTPAQFRQILSLLCLSSRRRALDGPLCRSLPALQVPQAPSIRFSPTSTQLSAAEGAAVSFGDLQCASWSSCAQAPPTCFTENQHRLFRILYLAISATSRGARAHCSATEGQKGAKEVALTLPKTDAAVTAKQFPSDIVECCNCTEEKESENSTYLTDSRVPALQPLQSQQMLAQQAPCQSQQVEAKYTMPLTLEPVMEMLL